MHSGRHPNRCIPSSARLHVIPGQGLDALRCFKGFGKGAERKSFLCLTPSMQGKGGGDAPKLQDAESF